MNLADIPAAADLSTRLGVVKKVIDEGPTAATITITTPGGTYMVPLNQTEWNLGLAQIKNEVVQALIALGVNVT